jgi:hypothetical protein
MLNTFWSLVEGLAREILWKNEMLGTGVAVLIERSKKQSWG